MSILSDIIAERRSWGDPVDVILNDNVSCLGSPLHRVVYDNGRWEWLADPHVNQCSAGVGGDPASGCETFVNPYEEDGLCASHRKACAIYEASPEDEARKDGDPLAESSQSD